MLKKAKETARDVALFALVGTLFYTFKTGVLVYKFKNWLKKPTPICLHCEEEVARGNGVDLGDGDCLCRNCYQKKDHYVPTFLRKQAV